MGTLHSLHIKLTLKGYIIYIKVLLYGTLTLFTLLTKL